MNQYVYFALGILLGIGISVYVYCIKEEKKQEMVKFIKRIFTTQKFNMIYNQTMINIIKKMEELERELTDEEKDEIIQQCFKEYYNSNNSDKSHIRSTKYYTSNKQLKKIKQNKNKSIALKIPRFLLKKFYYVMVKYIDSMDSKEYCYISSNTKIKIGDKVIVDRIGTYVVAEVIYTGFFTRYDAPYPIEKTKKVIEVITEKTKFSEYGIKKNH